MRTSVSRRVRSRLPRRDDDSGSLIFAMLLVLISTALASLMVPMLLLQINGTKSNLDAVRSLDAAQAGLDIAIGHIRAANDGAGNGVLSKLPCGPYAGTVGGGNASTYSVSIAYYTSDPKGLNAAQLAQINLPCLSGLGVENTPAYAQLQSQGTASGSGTLTRNMQATYIFQTTNQNIAGGLIHVYKTSTSTDLCIDAGSSSPGTGTKATMQACTAGSAQQKFAYNNNLTIQLVASVTAAQPTGMCLDAGSPEAVGAYVVFQPCASVAPTLTEQEWSLNDSANLQGTTDGVHANGLCFNVQTQNFPGSFIVLNNNCGGGYDNIQTFQPDPSVGAGNAGAPSGQLVNFNQFGRCIDVTEQNVNYGYIIVWPCKQNPDPSQDTWNQVWATPTIPNGSTSATGTITTATGGVTYCLKSPNSTNPAQYVTVVPCTVGAITQPEKWTMYSATGTYTTSYRIVDSTGYCLSPTDPTASPPDLYPNGNQISKLIVAPCTSATLQKWNAPPNILTPLPIENVGEH